MYKKGTSGKQNISWISKEVIFLFVVKLNICESISLTMLYIIEKL